MMSDSCLVQFLVCAVLLLVNCYHVPEKVVKNSKYSSQTLVLMCLLCWGGGGGVPSDNVARLCAMHWSALQRTTLTM